MNENNNNVMTPDHPQWVEFVEHLMGEEGLDFHQDPKKGVVWKCSGNSDKPFTTAILKKYFPEVDIEATMVYFAKKGGYCDCEILWNVDPD